MNEFSGGPLCGSRFSSLFCIDGGRGWLWKVETKDIILDEASSV